MKKIAILGTGGVGKTLAVKFVSLGYEVMMGTRDVSNKLAETSDDDEGNPPFIKWQSANKSVKLGSFKEAASFGDIVMNVTKGGVSLTALKSVDPKDLKGKILIDVSNALDFSKGMPAMIVPELCNTNSLGEEIQRTFPGARVVKTFNTLWSGFMVNPEILNKGDHAVFICGNDTEAKETVRNIMKSFGWIEKNILDLGDITGARAMEMYLTLWMRIFSATKNGAFNIKIVT